MNHRLTRMFRLLLIAVLLAGCRSPLGERGRGTDRALRATVDRAIAQELDAAPATPVREAGGLGPDRAAAPPPPRDVLTELAERRAELDALSPLPAGVRPQGDLGPDLAGRPQERIEISLQGAITAAIANNLALQVARLQPAIAAEDVALAEAIFDAVLFSSIDLARIDQPQRVPVIGGVPLGTPFSAFENYRFETGIRKRFSPGTDVFVSTELTRVRNRAPGIQFSPDPAYTGALTFGVGQPLLRGFGEDITTATIRLARNLQRRTAEQVQIDMLELVAQTERAYWDLEMAWRQLAIAEWLVQVGVEVREIMDRRREFDIRPAEHSDAVARVEQRQADVIRARRAVRQASDLLKTIINDPQIPVASEIVLHPLDAPAESPITYSLREVLLSAADHRPELRQVALDIDDVDIRELVARNERLPLLNLSAQAAFYGLNDTPGGAYRELGEASFIDYLAGILFEYPLGNNAAEARLRQVRLQRHATVLNYQRTLQQIVLEVKNALRDVVTNLELINATRSFRVAQAENLRTLLVEEEFLAALTPEFLNLKFQRQEILAQARSQEAQALAEFNKSLATLHRAMGTGLRLRQINIERD